MKLFTIVLTLLTAMVVSLSPTASQSTPSAGRIFAPEPVSVLTQRYDNARTSANLNEHVLSVSSVSSGQFQRLYSYPVDGQIYAQPLLDARVSFPDGVKNVLIVATMRNNVYAIKVDDAIYGPSPPEKIWKVNVGKPVAGDFMPMASSSYTCIGHFMCIPIVPPPKKPWPLPTVGASGEEVVGGSYGSYNINPSIGILSTPVIDEKIHRLFLVAKTMEATGPVNRLISLDLFTGQQIASVIVGDGVSVASDSSDSVSGRLSLNQAMQMQRPGLLLQNGEIYVALASHQDTIPWHGWVFGYDENLHLINFWCTTPKGMGGGIWQAGSGLAGDPQGNVYVMTGNGERDNGTDDSYNARDGNYAGMFVQLSPDLLPKASYSPPDERYREAADQDVGSSGPALVPGTTMVIGGDKESKLFVLDTAHGLAPQEVFQGGYRANPLPIAVNTHIHGTPAIWRSAKLGLMAYFWAERDYLRAYHWNDRTLNFGCPRTASQCSNDQTNTPYMQTARKATDCLACMPGGMLSISADDDADGTGIVWASTTTTNLKNNLYTLPAAPGLTSVVPGVLYAFDADDLSHVLWASDATPQGDPTFFFAKFNPPMVANGRVYLATFSGRIDIFGLRQWAKFVSPPIPERVVGAGSTFEVQVTLLNAGTSVWKAGSYSLASLSSGNGAPHTSGLPADVAPGNEVTVPIPIAAPPSPGTYSLQWRMVDSESKSFGETTPLQRYIVQ